MTLKISDDHMELEVAGTTIAGARVLADGRWRVIIWPTPLDRNQAITALTITELIEHGYPNCHPLVVALRDELA